MGAGFAGKMNKTKISNPVSIVFDMNKIAVICSEFNKDFVESLYSQAHKQFYEYKRKAAKLLSENSQDIKLCLDGHKNLPLLEFIQGKTELRKWIDNNPTKPPEQLLKQFIDPIIKLDIEPFWIPGAGEIPLAAQWVIENQQAPAVLALGVIVRGQTKHYDFLCRFLERSLWDLQKTYSLPIIFSVLMVENKQQAKERITKARGAEGMKSLIQMIQLHNHIKNKP